MTALQLIDRVQDLINKNEIISASEFIQQNLNDCNYDLVKDFLDDYFKDAGINESYISINKKPCFWYEIHYYNGNGFFTLDEGNEYSSRNGEYIVSFSESYNRLSPLEKRLLELERKKRDELYIQDLEQIFKTAIQKYYGKMSGDEIKRIFKYQHKKFFG